MPDDRELSEKLRWLAAFPQLADISDPAFLDAVRQSKRVTVPTGTVLVRKGSPCKNFLLLYKGCVRVQKTSHTGREIILCRVGPGELSVLALMSLANGTTYPAEAIVEKEVQGLCLGISQFKHAIAGSERFRNFVLKTMAERMRQMVALVGDVVFERLDARLASRLSELFEESNGNWVTITHEQLATELGTTREVISRMLKYLETQTGCIKLHRGRIELLSFSRLLQWAK